MSLVARCPSPGCRGSYRVPDDRAGTPIRCPLCKKSFTPSTETAAPPSTAPSSTGSSPTASKSSATTLDRVGRFLVLGKLGSGAFGTVFKARDPQLERDVALKVPNPSMLDTPKRVERFLREAKSAARLRHPNIVPVFDAGQDGDRYYIASAFIDGLPLSESIDERGTGFRRAAEIVRKLAEAVGYAHDQGIVHRDIKPANVMLDSREEPHLMDFGLAARADEAEKLTNDGAVLGTPAYMAPEQAAGQKGEASPLSDQYALGVVLYELLTGQAPFSGPPAAVIYKVIHHDPPPPRSFRPYVSRDLETICAKAMSKTPEGRYADCQELANDLGRWLAGELIAARRLTTIEKAVRWVKKNHRVSAAAVFMFVIVTVFALDATRRSRIADEERRRADETADENETLLRDALGLRDKETLTRNAALRMQEQRRLEIESLRAQVKNLIDQEKSSIERHKEVDALNLQVSRLLRLAIRKHDSMDYVSQMMEVTEVKVVGKLPLQVGGAIKFDFSLRNKGKVDLLPPVNRVVDKDAYAEIGLTSVWVERQGDDAEIPPLPKSTRRYVRKYVLHREFFFAGETIRAEQSIPIRRAMEPIDIQGYPPGRYRFGMTYESLEGRVIDSKWIELDVTTDGSVRTPEILKAVDPPPMSPPEMIEAAKLLGKWEQADRPRGSFPSTTEFLKNGNVVVIGAPGNTSFTVEGTYKLVGNKLTLALQPPEQLATTSTMTVHRLTQTELTTIDSKGKKIAMKRSK